MIIIIEGADLVGKTTIAKQLSEKIQIPQTGIWIDINNPKPAVVSVSKTLRMTIQALHPDIIFDRSFMSEWVYSQIKNKENDYIDDLIAEWGTLDDLFLIVLYANDEILRKRFNSRGDKNFTLEEILKVNALYKKLYNTASQKILSTWLDVSTMTKEQVIEQILKFVNYDKTLKIKS